MIVPLRPTRYRLCTALGVTIEQTDDLEVARSWANAYSIAAHARIEIRDGRDTVEAWDAGLVAPCLIDRQPYVWLTGADVFNLDDSAEAA